MFHLAHIKAAFKAFFCKFLKESASRVMRVEEKRYGDVNGRESTINKMLHGYTI